MATVRIQLRRGTAAEWTAANPVLAAGEMGLETDTGDFKFGDGSSAWGALSYSLGNAIDDYIPLSEKGNPDGVATLNSQGLIPVEQLPAAAALEVEVASSISTHNSDTTNVHGIADTSVLVTTTGNQTLTSKSLTSPALTGTPTAPTANVGTDTTQIATTAFVQDAIEAVVGAAPAALNTLAEIATSLNDDADLAGTLTTSIGTKVSKAGDTMSGVLDMGSNKVTNLGTPTSNFDAASKYYVDSRVAGDIGDHNDLTTNIHGIGNTADLVLTSDSRLSDERTPLNDSVSTAKLSNSAVATAKIENGAVSADKIGTDAVTEVKILNGSVTAAKIADDAVETAKIADYAVTTEKIADLNVTESKLDAGSVTEDKIATDAVTELKIADGSVTSAKIAASGVETANIAGLAVTDVKIADDAVTTAKIADSNVTESKINTGAVTAGKIGAGAVTEVKIADGSVTSAKIANGTIVDGDISGVAAIAQSKINGLTADLAAKALDSDLDAHTSATTSVHGIADTSVLATDSEVAAAQTAAQNFATSAISTHNADTTNVHGIVDTSKLVTTDAQSTTLDGALTIQGDLTVNGTTFNASATSITIEDNMVQLAHQNAANTVDLGLVVAYNDGTAKHAGIVRDVSDSKWKLFKGVTTEPSTTVDFTQGSLDDLAVAGLTATTVTPSSGVVFTDGTQTKAGVPSITPITEKTSNYTLSSLSERDTLIEVNHTGGSAVTITVPADSSVNYPVGTSIDILRTNTGEVTIAGSGATINATPGLKLRAQWSSATLFKRAANTWVLFGDLKA